MDIKRIVTARTEGGTSVFADLGEPRRATAGGMDIVNVWGTPDGGAQVAAGNIDDPVLFPFFPGPGGTRLCVVHFPPQSEGHDDDTDPEETQPGLIGVFEQDSPGMHTTDSVDYGICLSGEIILELDDGREELVTPGTIVVQRGTRHAWRNRSNEVCTMVYALIGAERI
ncbi:cupin domain-containing protein [Rhodococcus rhodochrous]|uniref:Cupin domain-containing protein n=1 Tax=Rhodococcus rhodochrous TaxID=1829 RepID=A0AAW4XNX6_RHORH|nr:cupin domain-containing protein [Rhodococcus rhodochrous]MCD2114599.1 cupin domain-containing protein [Rhodococcus rhodochrous]